MRLGILSDSHGHASRTALAIDRLLAEGADRLIHLGDVETDEVIDALAGHPAHLVFGNCDWDINRLTQYATRLGINVDHPLGRLEADDTVIAFTHGHLTRLVDQSLRDNVDYLLLGHSHELRDERIGNTRIINPGALFRAASYTAAILDVGKDELRILEVERKHV